MWCLLFLYILPLGSNCSRDPLLLLALTQATERYIFRPHLYAYLPAEQWLLLVHIVMSTKSVTSDSGRSSHPASTYYVYHEGEEHFLVSPVAKPPKVKKKKNKANQDDNTGSEKGTAETNWKEMVADEDCYFVQ